MTYDRMKLDDYQILDVLEVASREGALVMVHAENNDMIRWLARRLVDRGQGQAGGDPAQDLALGGAGVEIADLPAADLQPRYAEL